MQGVWSILRHEPFPDSWIGIGKSAVNKNSLSHAWSDGKENRPVIRNGSCPEDR